MSPQISTFSKFLVTNITFIRPFACMTPYVDLKGTRSHERLITDVALEGPLTSMTPVMVREMSMCRE